MRKGDRLEQDYSKTIHQDGIPVLVSSLLLRSNEAGQVDLAKLSKNKKSWVLSLYEVKYSQNPSRSQLVRLWRAQDYLSRVLDLETKLEVKFCQKDQP